MDTTKDSQVKTGSTKENMDTDADSSKLQPEMHRPITRSQAKPKVANDKPKVANASFEKQDSSLSLQPSDFKSEIKSKNLPDVRAKPKVEKPGLNAKTNSQQGSADVDSDIEIVEGGESAGSSEYEESEEDSDSDNPRNAPQPGTLLWIEQCSWLCCFDLFVGEFVFLQAEESSSVPFYVAEVIEPKRDGFLLVQYYQAKTVFGKYEPALMSDGKAWLDEVQHETIFWDVLELTDEDTIPWELERDLRAKFKM